MKTIFLLKASVRGYTRKDGTVVKPYSTKTPSAKGDTRAQGDLFGGGGAKLPPNRFKGVDPVAATPDLFSDTVTEPRKDLIAEHKRLVAVLRSPSHKDDQAEAKRQEAELKEYEQEDEHSHLLADLPAGAKWKRGKGVINGHYGVELSGEVVGNFHKNPEDAAKDAYNVLLQRQQFAKEAEEKETNIKAARERILSGGEVTDADLKLMGIKASMSGMEYFISRAAKLFGIPSRQVRPFVKDLIKIGHTENGVRKEFVPPKKALRAIADGLNPHAGTGSQTLKASELTFGHIKSLIGNSLNVHEWDVDNGGKVKAQVKTTTRNGTIHTAYMHITIVHPSGKWEYYRENSSGKFDLVSSGVEKQEVKAPDPVDKTETPAFRKWFGNSKVVDAEGKPLVVYHSTPNDFTEFKPGGDDSTKSGHAMWFGVDAHNPQAAHNVLNGRRAGNFKEGVRTMPVYLSMKRPLIIDDSTREWARSVWGSDFPQVISKDTVDDLRQEYDGVIFHSPLTNKPSEYIVFEPNQVKSATGNNGDYSSHPDITKSILFLKARP